MEPPGAAEGRARARELRDGGYQPGEYRQFLLHEHKPRLISAAPFRDRVVHHALCNVIEPIFDRGFIHDSYACRKGKGTHAAVDRYTEFSRRNEHVLKGDIIRYFGSIDRVHEYVVRNLLGTSLSRYVEDACEYYGLDPSQMTRPGRRIAWATEGALFLARDDMLAKDVASAVRSHFERLFLDTFRLLLYLALGIQAIEFPSAREEFGAEFEREWRQGSERWGSSGGLRQGPARACEGEARQWRSVQWERCRAGRGLGAGARRGRARRGGVHSARCPVPLCR